jgi:F-type H+-transporting ATPase subunit O
MAAGLTANSAH